MRLVGRPELVEEEWFASGDQRAQHADEIDAAVATWISERSTPEVVATRLRLHTTVELQVEADDFTFAAGLEAAGALFEQSTPDAIMCANDLIAVAAMKVATARGLSVPGDVALVGMDDTDIAEVANPSLTSVDLGSAQRARQAAELLLARLADPDHPCRRVVVPPRLTIRQSSVVAAAPGSPPARKGDRRRG